MGFVVNKDDCCNSFAILIFLTNLFNQMNIERAGNPKTTWKCLQTHKEQIGYTSVSQL